MILPVMDIVKQTGKTIIFDRYNGSDECDDLITLLTRDTNPLSTEEFVNKMKTLEVKNFAEFVEKFAPKVYEVVVNNNGVPNFVYSFEKPKGEYTEINLADHAFYKMVMAMLDSKGESGKSNREFDYDELKQLLTPKAQMDEAKQIRKNLDSNQKEYLKLTAGGKPCEEAKRYAKNIMDCRQKIIDKYQNKSPLALLPLAIADKEQQLALINKSFPSSGDNSTPLLASNFTFDDTGNLKVIENKTSDDKEINLIEPTSGTENKLREAVRKDFEKNANDVLKESKYLSELVVNVFVPNISSQLSVDGKEKIEEQKNIYILVYQNSLENFAKEVSRVVEKFAGVKEFFDHATYKGKLASNVSVIISNCTAAEILKDSEAKKRLAKYLTDLSHEKDVNRIWFGILPSIANPNETSVDEGDFDPFGDLNVNSSDVNETREGLISCNAAKEMLKILSDGKIMTFMSYKASEETGFAKLSEDKVNEYVEEFGNLNSDYGVFTYPNFTVIPKEANAVKLGQNGNSDVYMSIPGIYVDSCYIACGLVVGSQNSDYLASLKFESNKKRMPVNKSYPCVRFDFEEADNYKVMLSRMNRETSTEMQESTKKAILKNCFGFVFADNKLTYDGSIIDNCYVMQARNLKRAESGNFKHLYKPLVKNLVTQLLSTSNDKITDNVVKNFLEDYVENWKTDNKDEDRNYVNKLLHEGEEITVEDHHLKVVFNKEEELWDDIDIVEGA